jgi:hypothetical protein
VSILESTLEIVLGTVRGLVDEALTDSAHKPAATLSAIASKLDIAVRAEKKIAEKFIDVAALDARAVAAVDDFLPFLARQLDQDDYELAASVMQTALPKPRVRDDGITRLATEIDQIKSLLDLAIEARELGDVKRLASLLIGKCKAYTYARIDAKELVGEDFTDSTCEAFAKAVTASRDLVDSEKFNDAVDQFAAERRVDDGK